MLKQTEEDADKEILELKTKYEKILRSERHSDPKSIITFGNSAFFRLYF
jgi:vacuolar-type H+-ATPase subunit H